MPTRGNTFTMQTSARLWQWAGKNDVPPTHHLYFMVIPRCRNQLLTPISE